jgi:two-component system alkaline phosphatase synthesis response regulator PhoP
MAKILIIEDEPDMVLGLKDNFEFEGYEVSTASDGVAGLERARSHKPDVVILDIMLPKLSGLEVCKALRSEGFEAPIVMLTARGQEIDKVVGLELGADDYVTKPFSPRELATRVRTVLRRSNPAVDSSAQLSFDGLELDAATREAHLDGQQLRLTAKEFDLLFFLASNPRNVFSRDQLMSRVWGYEAARDTGTVTVHIRRLRAKIERDPANPLRLETIWGVGYRFLP